MKMDKPKMVWFSPTFFVFEWETDFGSHFPWGYHVLGKKKLLVIAEQGKELYFLDEKGESGYSGNDVLCYFCEYGINLGRLGYMQTCLLSKDCVGVMFCRDFVPGVSFGESKARDIGKRRELAEKVLAQLVWHCCSDCENWNNNNVYTFAPDGKVYEDSDAAFCEVLRRKPELGYHRTCKNFELTHDPDERESLLSCERRLFEYIEELKVLEKQKLRKMKSAKYYVSAKSVSNRDNLNIQRFT